jgi:hypothetical protein
MPALRLTVAGDCELRLVVSLPRVFKDNNARKAIVYLVRRRRPASNRKVALTEIKETWRDADNVEQPTDLFGELEAVIGNYLHH